MDAYDLEILTQVQRDGRISNRDLAERIGLSPAPCWRRFKELEKKGLIGRYAALLDRNALGLQITALAQVSLENHHADTVAAFDAAIQSWPQVLECHKTSGDYDYLLKIVTTDMAGYETFLSTRLLQLPSVRSVSTSFSLSEKKATTALPLDHLKADLTGRRK